MSIGARVRTRLRARRARHLPVVHFLHIGKTGGTAVRHAVETTPSARYRVEVHRHGFTLADVPAGEPFLFVVRDPVTRFVSGFNSRLRQGLPRYRVPWSEGEARAFTRFPTAPELAAGLSSPDDETREAARDAMGAIRHVSTSYLDWFGSEDALRARVDDLLFIGFQEQLDADFERLRDVLALPADARLPDDDVAAHRNPADLPRQLDETGLANIRAWYADDERFVATCRALRAQLDRR